MAQIIKMLDGIHYYFTEADHMLIRVRYTYMHALEFPGEDNLIAVTSAHCKKLGEYSPYEYTWRKRKEWQAEILKLLRPE